MPVTSSGEIKLIADINQEINGNNTDDNVSLRTLSENAGKSAPDGLTEFYGYSNVTLPTIGNRAISTNNVDGTIAARGILQGNGGGTISDYGIYVGTSNNLGSATKYSGGSSWGMYSYKYPSATGFSNSTTYHVWIYAENEAGIQSYYVAQITTPPPYIPISNYSYSFYGDVTGANYCPNLNFIGGCNFVWTNNTSSTTIAVYGDSNFSYHGSGSKPNCLNEQTFSTDSSPRNRNLSNSGTCRDNTTCGNSRTFYSKWYYSGYTDRVNSYTRACPSC
jgi:hypothetical protein